MQEFIHDGHAGRIVFGTGSLNEIGGELERLGLHRAMLICTAGRVQDSRRLTHLLGDRAVGTFGDAAMHVPLHTAHAATLLAQKLRADCTIAFGGGSAIGLSKAVALELGLAIIAIPMTYAGSEMTPIYGLTEQGVKRTGKDIRVLPRAVIYDPLLSLELPLSLSIASGMNAIAHAAEGLYAASSNPIMSLIAEEGVRVMAGAIQSLRANQRDLEARSQALYAACLCGLVLGSQGMALHHKLCHTLGGSFDLPHAQLHAIMLPHVMAYNLPAAAQAFERLSRALNRDDPAAALLELGRVEGMQASLKTLGMDEEDLDRAAELAVANPYWNPRPFTRDDIRALLQRAWRGTLAPS